MKKMHQGIRSALNREGYLDFHKEVSYKYPEAEITVAPQLSVVMESMSSFRACVVMTYYDKNSINAISKRICLYDSFHCSLLYSYLGAVIQGKPFGSLRDSSDMVLLGSILDFR